MLLKKIPKSLLDPLYIHLYSLTPSLSPLHLTFKYAWYFFFSACKTSWRMMLSIALSAWYKSLLFPLQTKCLPYIYIYFTALL